MSSESDKALLESYRNGGDVNAIFHTLVDKYQERLYWPIRRIVLVHEDADDVLQNTFIKIWKGLPSFRADSELYTWMYRIAMNEALSFKKRNAMKVSGQTSEGHEEMMTRLHADPYYDGNEVLDKLQKVIMQLPDKQREVFELRYFQEMKYDEMADILQTSVGALKASYHHAVKKIEKAFSED